MALSKGDQAPDFTLVTLGAEGPETWTLSEHLSEGPLLVLFVPMAFTSVCTDEFCMMSESLSEYESLGAKVVGISGDGPFAQQAWAEKEGFKLQMLSDYEHEVAKAFGVAYESFLPEANLIMGGVAKRSAFVIGKDGVVVHADVQDHPKDLPDFEAVKAVLS